MIFDSSIVLYLVELYQIPLSVADAA